MTDFATLMFWLGAGAYVLSMFCVGLVIVYAVNRVERFKIDSRRDEEAMYWTIVLWPVAIPLRLGLLAWTRIAIKVQSLAIRKRRSIIDP